MEVNILSSRAVFKQNLGLNLAQRDVGVQCWQEMVACLQPFLNYFFLGAGDVAGDLILHNYNCSNKGIVSLIIL